MSQPSAWLTQVGLVVDSSPGPSESTIWRTPIQVWTDSWPDRSWGRAAWLPGCAPLPSDGNPPHHFIVFVRSHDSPNRLETMNHVNLDKNRLRLFYVPKIRLGPLSSNFRHDPVLRQRVRQMYREMSGPLGQQLEQEHAAYWARCELSEVSKRARAEYEIAKRLGVRGRARDRYIA